MNADLILFFNLFLFGTIGHLLFRRSGDFGLWIMSLGNRGEGDTGKGDGDKGGDKPVTFTPEQQKAVDHVVQERVARERQKYGDYDDLKKFKTEHDKQQDVKAQDELVKQKKFEEAEAGYKTKINEYSQVVSKKDQEIQDLKIGHALSNEISKNNGYAEESMALLMGKVTVDASGNMTIKGKDANGIDINSPLADGVKKFLTERPHLIKSSHKSGSGSGSGDNGSGAGEDGAGGGKGEDLNSLNTQYKQAMDTRDLKKASEIRTKIKAAMSAKGVSV